MDTGYRLGSGQGYYDRSFAFKKNDARIKPQLIGVAYRSSIVCEWSPQAWDVPCDHCIWVDPLEIDVE